MYDVAVLGCGPAGFTCAFESARLGMKVAIIEKGALGGVGAQTGALPAKAMAAAVSKGILDWNKIREHVISVQQSAAWTMETKLYRAGVDIFRGEGSFLSPQEIQVGEIVVQAKNVVLATGTSPYGLPHFPLTPPFVVSHEEAISFPSLPNEMIIVGGGVEGCEFASIFSGLGCKVTIVEKKATILEGEDKECISFLTSKFTSLGIKILTCTGVLSYEEKLGKVYVKISDGEGEKTLSCDCVLLTGGRKPNLPKGVEQIGLRIKEDESVAVGENFGTNLPNLYAVGDINGIMPIAHTGMQQGKALAHFFSHREPVRLNYEVLPHTFFTVPELVGAGKTEQMLKKNKVSYRVGMAQFKDNFRAQTLGLKEGFIKVIISADRKTLYGVHGVGIGLGEVLTAASLALQQRLVPEQLTDLLYVYPTLGEALRDAIEEALFAPLSF